MKTFRILCFLGGLLPFLCVSGHSADEPSAANRAYLYQRAARTILERHHWQISQDRSGKLVAMKVERPSTLIPFFTVATLTLTFRPDSVIQTTCAANIVATTYEKGNGTPSKVAGPLPDNTTENIKDIQTILAEAGKQLTKEHPEHAKP